MRNSSVRDELSDPIRIVSVPRENGIRHLERSFG